MPGMGPESGIGSTPPEEEKAHLAVDPPGVELSQPEPEVVVDPTPLSDVELAAQMPEPQPAPVDLPTPPPPAEVVDASTDEAPTATPGQTVNPAPLPSQVTEGSDPEPAKEAPTKPGGFFNKIFGGLFGGPKADDSGLPLVDNDTGQHKIIDVTDPARRAELERLEARPGPGVVNSEDQDALQRGRMDAVEPDKDKTTV